MPIRVDYPPIDRTHFFRTVWQHIGSADGMGGTNAGEVASAIAIETVQNAFTPENLGDIVTQEGIVTSEEAVEEFLSRTVKTADLNIVNASKEDSSTREWVLLLSLLGY